MPPIDPNQRLVCDTTLLYSMSMQHTLEPFLCSTLSFFWLLLEDGLDRSPEKQVHGCNVDHVAMENST